MSVDKPGKPESLAVGDVTDTSCALSWQPPASDGGDAISVYVVESRMEGGFKWAEAGRSPATSFTVSGLKTDRTFEFRVSAENRAGVGPPSDPTAPVVAKAPLGTHRPT